MVFYKSAFSFTSSYLLIPTMNQCSVFSPKLSETRSSVSHELSLSQSFEFSSSHVFNPASERHTSTRIWVLVVLLPTTADAKLVRSTSCSSQALLSCLSRSRGMKRLSLCQFFRQFHLSGVSSLRLFDPRTPGGRTPY